MNENESKRLFSLLKDPWIPIAGLGEVSLTELFTHPEYARLGGTPVEKVVILRFLLCIAHASTPLPDVDAWSALTPEKLAANALEYLEKWKDRFDLYDEKRPFLQFPQLRGQCEGTDINVLSLNVASGNNTLFTEWHLKHPLTDAEIVRLLLSGSNFCLSGGSHCDHSAKIDPILEKEKKRKDKSAPQGTLLGKKGFLHSFLIGSTIVETLHLNMLTDEDRKELCPSMVLGCPFWESMPTDERGKSARAYSASYHGILFPMNQFFYLANDSVIIAQGIFGEFYPSPEKGQWDPGISFSREKKKVKVCWCDSTQSPWRQLPSLLQISNLKATDAKPAFVVRGLEKLSSEITSFGLWVGGVEVTDKLGEQIISKTNSYVNSEFLIPIKWKDKNFWSRYKEFMKEIDNIAEKELGDKVQCYYRELSDPTKKSEGNENQWPPICKAKGGEAKRLFWERMERMAQEVIDLSVETEQDIVNSAKRKWQEVALSCYREICPCITPRQMQAYVQCMPTFKKKEGKK